jgi:hypothetical protein
MRRGFLFKTGRVAAIASLGSFAHALPGPTVERGRNVHEVQVLNFLDELWNEAWNADFVLRESGMGLTPSPRSASWSVTVYDQQGPIAAGSYDEVLRLLTPEPGAWAIDGEFATIELFVTAGLLHGVDGFLTPTWGLARRITLAGDDDTAGQVVEGFTPLGTADDLALAVAAAAYLYDFLSSLAMLAADEPYTTDPCLCRQIHDTDVAACSASTLACDLKCTTIAIGAIAACFAAGPFMPVCVTLIIAAEIVCLASCESSYRACALRAHSARLRCLQACDEIRR